MSHYEELPVQPPSPSPKSQQISQLEFNLVTKEEKLNWPSCGMTVAWKLVCAWMNISSHGLFNCINARCNSTTCGWGWLKCMWMFEFESSYIWQPFCVLGEEVFKLYKSWLTHQSRGYERVKKVSTVCCLPECENVPCRFASDGKPALQSMFL